MAQSSDTITLINGTRLECFPLALPPEIIKGNTIMSDTNGDTNWVGNTLKPGQKPEDFRKERDKADRLFYEHAHLFLSNADRILSDSRMFLTPLDIVNGMAYTGPFGTPTLGAYIEWWLYHRQVSFDKDDYPIWHISGSALTGAHACSSVDLEGKSISAQLKGAFRDVRDSFLQVNRRYKDAIGRYITFTLQEVIEILKGNADATQTFNKHLRLERMKYQDCITTLQDALTQTREQARNYEDKIRHLLVSQHREAIEQYYHRCLNLQATATLAREYYQEQRLGLRQELRAGRLDNKSYQQQLTSLRRRAQEAERESSRYERIGLEEILGLDSRYIPFDVIETILTELK